MMTSSSQKEKILNKISILPSKDPPEGRTTAIVAVMRGKPKHGHHRQRSNKHYKQKLVQVLSDSGSNGDLVFIDKDKPMLLPSSKKLDPQSWNTSNGMFQTKWKAEIELNFFEYSDSKRYLAEPNIVEYDKINKPQYDIILGVKTMKKYGIILDFKDKMITVDEVKLPMQNINYLQGSSTLRVLRLNHSLAMEPQSTQDATKHVTQILDAKYQKRSPVNCQKQLQASKRQSAKEVTVATQEIWVALWWHIRWLEDQAGLIPIKGGSITLPWSSFPSAKNPQRHHHKRGGEIVPTGGIREAACIWMGFAIFHHT
jgi:hypothetical protein